MRRILLPAALLLLAAAHAFAFTNNSKDRSSMGNDIVVHEGETAQDIACGFCSVHIHGDVKGDVAVLFGNVSVDADHSIAGDVAILGGNLHLDSNSLIGGDVAIAAGSLTSAENASVRGDRAILPGHFWLLVPFAPLLLLIGIIWLIVYLVRRRRYQFPAHPQHRAF